MALDRRAWRTEEGALEQRALSEPSAWAGLQQALSPIEERPKLVAETEVAHFTTRDGTPYVVVHNLARHTYLKLDPREFDLLPLMDGIRSVKGLAVAYYQRHGVLALPRVAGLVRLLRDRSFLADPSLDAYEALRQRLRRLGAGAVLGSVARAFLHAEVGLGDVDAFLGSCYRAWGWVFFTRPAVWLGAVLGLLGPLFFYLELARGRYLLFQFAGSYLAGLLLLLGLGLLVLALHELGHGLAVKHARRTVHRAGLMVYYGLPTAFVDTTDVWMAPRPLRLAASLAGPWTGLALGGACALAALALPEGPVGAVLFSWGFVFLLVNLLNFNPLLELDGYYLLADLVEKPMLRTRALGFVRGPLWSKLRKGARLSEEERFFALFGLAAATWSVVAPLLAVRFWQLRLEPLAVELWTSGHPLARAGVLAAAGLAAVALLLGLWALVRRLLKGAVLKLEWLAGRAAARRRRAAVEALKAVPLWAQMPEGALLEVARHMRPEVASPGTEVVRQGEAGDRFYLVADGSLEVLVDGRPVARLRRGDYFGEGALLTSASREATVLALTSSRLFSLDQAAFRATLAHDLATRLRLEGALAYRAEVAEIAIFRDLSPTELDLLLTRLTPVSATLGEAVIRQGEPGDRFYVIRSGTVEVVRDGELLGVLGPGEAFGEIALLLDVPRTATVRATEPTELLALNASDFRDLLASYCSRAGELQRLSHLRLASHKRLDEVLAAGRTVSAADRGLGAAEAG